MEKPVETTTPTAEKRPLNWGFIVWPLVVLALYALSYGPYQKIVVRRSIPWEPPFSANMYSPLGWIYWKTPLHKPLGMYLHLWSPKDFDAKGNEVPVFR